MDSLDAKINKIAQQHENAISETPDEKRDAKLKELYAALISARSTYKNSPLMVDVAEKEYYQLKDGPVVYEQQQLKKYKLEAEDLKKEMMNEQHSTIKSTLETLAYYNSQQTYSNNINTIKLTLLQNIMKKIKEIKHEYSDKTTNNRKTYYLLEEQESITFWLQFVNYCILSFIIIFIIYSVKEDHVTKYTYAFTIVGLIIVFYLEPLVKLIQSIPLSFNVYTSWGEDTEKPTTTFYVILLISAVLFFIIYKKNAVIDNYFQ
jgi:hypothetical protein